MPPIELRPLSRADFPSLRQWLNEPHVREWWRGPILGPAEVEREYGPSVDGAEPTRCRVILADGEPVGLIQGYRHADHPEWDQAVGIPRAAGLDYLIGRPDRRGQGIAPAAIRAFADELLALHPDTALVVSVPQKANRASCRALEKAGFTFSHDADLDTDDPSDSDTSAIYTYARPAGTGEPHVCDPDAHPDSHPDSHSEEEPARD